MDQWDMDRWKGVVRTANAGKLSLDCMYVLFTKEKENKRKLLGTTRGLSPQLEEQSGKDHEGAGPLQDGKAMLEDNITSKYRTKLPRGHNSGIQKRAVHLNGIGNSKLSRDSR